MQNILGLIYPAPFNRIVSSATRPLNFVRRNIKTKIPKVRETAYNSLVRPQLEYASAVWDPNFAIRNVSLKLNKSSEELLAGQLAILIKGQV